MNDDERFEVILIECLEAMEAGATVEQLLARYPSDAIQLGTALRVAARLREMGGDGPAPAMQKRARAAFLTQAASMRPAPPPASRARWLLRPLVSFVTVVVLVALVGGGVLGVSAASLPGDPLYNLKRSFEDFRVSLTRDPVRRVNLEESYAQRRTDEVKAVQAAKRTASVQFSALVEAMNGVWVVGGFTVQVPPSASIHGKPQIGEFVEVTGHTRSDGQIVADQIEVESEEFIGVVEAMNTPTWIIGGQRVLVTSQTQVIGVARLGAPAEVHVRAFADGTLLALKIDFQHQDMPAGDSNQGTAPQPIPTLPPTATPRPMPSPTLQPTPSSTPRRIEMPEPTATREHADATPEPTESHDGPSTPKPTESHEDHHTPEPTESHGGPSTPELKPTEAHDDHDTPEPKPTDNHDGSNNGPSTPEPKPTEGSGEH
jgi:hypothetical protein